MIGARVVPAFLLYTFGWCSIADKVWPAYTPFYYTDIIPGAAKAFCCAIFFAERFPVGDLVSES